MNARQTGRLFNVLLAGLLAQVLFTSQVSALSPEDLIFSVSFDKSLDADFAAGSPAAKVEGTVDFVPNDNVKDLSGRNGTRAARFVKKGDVLRYAVAGNVNLPQGAISLWLYEIDTQPGQLIWNPYFQVAGKDESLNLLHLWQPPQWSGGFWRQGGKVAALGSYVAVVPGQDTGKPGLAQSWYHLLFTWRKNEMSLYVNGKLADQQDNLDYMFLAPPESFTLGRPANPTVNADDFHTGEHMLKDAPAKAEEMKIGKETYGAYLLDDVAIFNRFLGPEEAMVLFSKPLDDALVAGITGSPKLAIRHFVSSRRVKVDADFGRLLPEGVPVEARVLKADGAPTEVKTALPVVPGGLDYGMLDVKSLPEGSYKVVATLLKDGQAIAETPAQPFEITPPEEWMTNTYGQADVVLPGFEPLKARDGVVAIWGRTYDFINAIMPRQIVNQGKEMLARPINWFARVNGQNLPLSVEAMKQVESSDTRARYEGKGQLGPLAVTAKVLVEYDGFMKFDITFAPGQEPVAIEALWMDIPFVPAIAGNMYHPTRRSGVWDKTWKSPLRLIYTSAITVGTPDTVLQWLTESDQHYHPRGNQKALETVEEEGARVFRATVLAEKKEIRQPFSLTFALHAGPVKARPQGWRGWTKIGRRYLEPGRHTDVANHYFNGWWSQAPGSLVVREGITEEFLKDRIDGTSMHFQGFRAFAEKNPQKRLPEWEKYEEEWSRVPVGKTNPKGTGWCETYVDTNSSWAQWHAYTCYKLFSETGMRGLYYDDWTHGVSMNEAAGSGYVDEEGIRRPTWPIFSQRELHRRTYAIIKQFRPDDGIKTIHTSSVLLLPVVSFCDLMLDGEIMGWTDMRPPKGNYFDTFRLDLMQMIFSGKNYGPVPLYYEYPNWDEKGKPWNQRKLWALLLSHDIHAYCSVWSAELLYFYLDHGFPLTDPGVEFHSYWDDNPAAKVVRAASKKADGTEEVDRNSVCYASAYSKPTGEALVIVVRNAPNNWSNVMDVEVKLDRKRLRLPEGDLVSLELETLGRKAKGVVEGDVLKVPVGVDDFSAVIIKRAR